MFTFTPKHARLVNACYTAEHSVNLSVLLHHIHLKPDRLDKITAFLISKMVYEIQNTGSCETTCNIILKIMNEFSEKVSFYEVNVLKAVGEAIRKMTKKYIKEDSSVVESANGSVQNLQSYEPFEGLINIVTRFENGMRSYEGENQASKLIVLVCKCLYDEFFVRLLCALIRVRELFHNSYEKKIGCCVDALMCNQWFNCLVNLGDVINIVNVRLFCYEIIKKGSQRNINIESIIRSLKHEMGVFAIIEINHYLVDIIPRLREMIDQEQILTKCLTESSSVIEEQGMKDIQKNSPEVSTKRVLHDVDLKTTAEAKRTSELINKIERLEIDDTVEIKNEAPLNDTAIHGQSKEKYNIFVADQIKEVDDLDLNSKYQTKSAEIIIDPVFPPMVFDPEYNDIILLLQWATNLLPEYITFSIIELGQSFFTLLRSLYSEESRMPHRKSFIFTYIRNFLNNCSVTSDILYIYVKKSFQYNFAPNSFKVSEYSIDFQTTILMLTKEYSQSYILVLDSKFISLLIKISEHVFSHKEFCYSILLNALRGAMPSGEKGQALHGKIRSLYYTSGNNTLFRILKLFLEVQEDRDFNKETLRVMKIIKTQKGDPEEVQRLCMATGNEAIFTEENTLYEKKDEDTKLYEEIYGVLYRLYSQSLKSSYNLESLAKKRRSRIRGIEFFK